MTRRGRCLVGRFWGGFGMMGFRGRGRDGRGVVGG